MGETTPTQYPYRFALIYAGLGVVAIGVVVATVLAILVPSATHVAHKADIRRAVGATDYVRIAEAEVQRQAQGYNLVVKSEKVVSAKETGDTATVVLKIHTVDAVSGAPADFTLRIDLSKSVYSVTGVKAV